MPSMISETEREMIEAFERTKGVTKCPPAGTARPAPYAWDAGKRNLVAVEQKPASTTWRRGGGVSPEVAQRRLKVREMALQGKTAPEIAGLLQVSETTIYTDAKAGGITLTTVEQARAKANQPSAAEARAAAIAARRERVGEMVERGFTVVRMAEKLGVSTATISGDLKKLGLKLTGEKPPAPEAAVAPKAEAAAAAEPFVLGDKAAAKKEASADRALERVRDRRRFKTVPVPVGSYGTRADPNATGTRFPSRVFDPVEPEHVLKDGSSNSKIGGDVLVGWLKGARIFTLTLEERATCPRHCAHWSGCYGNSMQHARRWRHGPELLEAIRLELMDLCSTHKPVLIRLHVLGNFWSAEYVQFWGKQLKAHKGLYLFGFTAHKRESEIGRELAKISTKARGRVWIRHSEITGPMGSFTLDFPTERKTIGDAVVCPEQRDAMAGARKGTHCGSCGVCWSSDRPIAFVVH